MNTTIGISNIIIVYEIIYLVLYFTKIISLDLISPLVIINIFIIFVMYFTQCRISWNTIFLLTVVKVLLLIFVLKISKFSFKNYFIGLSILLIYYLISDINDVYNCNINDNDLLLSIIFSSLVYFVTMLTN